jgi:hypothetical protein
MAPPHVEGRVHDRPCHERFAALRAIAAHAGSAEQEHAGQDRAQPRLRPVGSADGHFVYEAN